MDTQTIVLGLVILNVLQFVFWTWQINKLVDKLMSRNYAEYVSVTKPVETSMSSVQLPVKDDDDVLQDLNRMLS